MENSIILALFKTRRQGFDINQIMEEMELLTRSAGGTVHGKFFQKKDIPDKRFLLGKGKVHEIKEYINENNIDLIVVYNQLSNLQQKNLEALFNRKVIDRTRLILDIFATRAQSLEGKLQVELAQLLYLLPRLTGIGVDLSRLGGGIGTRGPGETKLEADRRTINKRISIIKKRLSKVIKNRKTQRKSRQLNPLPIVSLVGYTSAGKSTLFRGLTGEKVNISAMLFSTLDPVLRRVDLKEIEEGYSFLLSDTVGFIREMPSELSKSFKATLEEIVRSDLILHVIDISDHSYLDRKQEVQKILKELGIPEDKVIQVNNKIDLLNGKYNCLNFNNKNKNKIVYISAEKKLGFLELKKMIFNAYFKDFARYKIKIPKKLLNIDSLRNWAIVLNKSYIEEYIIIEILCSQKNMVKFKKRYGGYLI